MAKLESFNSREEKNKRFIEERQNLIQVCYEFLIKFCAKQKSLNCIRGTISELIDSIQLIEDLKFLIKN